MTNTPEPPIPSSLNEKALDHAYDVYRIAGVSTFTAVNIIQAYLSNLPKRPSPNSSLIKALETNPKRMIDAGGKAAMLLTDVVAIVREHLYAGESASSVLGSPAPDEPSESSVMGESGDSGDTRRGPFDSATPTQPSEISDVGEVYQVGQLSDVPTANGDQLLNLCMLLADLVENGRPYLASMAALIRPYLRTTEPVSSLVELRDELDVLVSASLEGQGVAGRLQAIITKIDEGKYVS